MHGLENLSRSGDAHDGSLRIANAIRGHAVVESVSDTGVTREQNPEVELVLTVAIPGRAPYEATVRQVLSRRVLHNLGPGMPVSVAVDRDDPAHIEIG
jgi:hypothetical protein